MRLAWSWAEVPMFFWRPKPDVLVAGAGPVGLFAALSLVRRGIRVRVIDEEWRSSTHSYALALHPRSLELLDELGLVDSILGRARKISTVGLYDREGRKGAFDLGTLDSRFPFLAVLAQGDFEAVLAGALHKRGVEVEWNHRLSRVQARANHVEATIDTLGKETVGYGVAQTETMVESSKDIEVPFVIGADGHDSLVRTQLGIDFEPLRPADEFGVFEFEADGELPDEMCVVLEDGHTNVLWPMKGNTYRWSFQLDPGLATPDSRDKDRLLMPLDALEPPKLRLLDPKYLRQLVSERAPWFQANIGSVFWHMGVRFEYRLAESFGLAHIGLAGDAGHMTGPVGVQSMNIGLAEAAELAEVISGILGGRASVDALALYSSRRVGEWSRLLNVGEPGLRPTERASSWARERAERLTACIPASGDHYAKLAAQLGLEPRVA